jgi:hypothetical protein
VAFIKQEFPRFFNPAPCDLIWLIAINWFVIDGENKCTFCGDRAGCFGEAGTTDLPFTCLPETEGLVVDFVCASAFDAAFVGGTGALEDGVGSGAATVGRGGIGLDGAFRSVDPLECAGGLTLDTLDGGRGGLEERDEGDIVGAEDAIGGVLEMLANSVLISVDGVEHDAIMTDGGFV